MRMKFTDIVEFSGKTCSTFDGKKNYISTGCVHDDHICKDEIETVEYINKPSRANLVVEPGDILFAKMQATKKTLLINEDLSQNIYSTGFYAVKPKDGLITKKCLFYLINSSLFLGEKDKNCSGATQKAINYQGLSSIELNIPEFSVQKLLTQKLDVLSKVIEVKRSQIRFFDNLIKARFVEMFSFVDSEQVKIAELVEQKIPTAKKDFESDTEIKYIDISSIDNRRNIVTGSTKYKMSNAPSRAQQHVQFGDILISTVRPNLKNVAMVSLDNDNLVASSGFCVLRPKKCTPEFLMSIVCSDNFTNAMINVVTGANYPAIKNSDILNYYAPLPSKGQQKQFSNFVAQVDKSKFALVKSIKLLKSHPLICF